ncbi:YceI family protein [Pseudomonas sp. BN515]|uniref:YceI family protein n=1 Tax=Pseudomonas sp. BN515 TaxID=2567892 RepID=UPI00245472DE|nr:YceI family protein [Pseudomonas sp. BN515]MDH4869234.1 YceI family protein [Pseudomonas sp. BN515]
MHKSIRPLIALLGALALPVQASWYLDNESSRISFISTKAGSISEVHRFLTLHGKIGKEGKAHLRVELESVSTGVPLRDQRLRDQFFEITKYPEAEITAQLDLRPITDLAPGAQLELGLPLTVKLHDKSQQYRAELLATRLDDHRFQVVTLAPLVLQVEDFGLTTALDGLRKVAGLPGISLSVPVGAVLIFTER